MFIAFTHPSQSSRNRLNAVIVTKSGTPPFRRRSMLTGPPSTASVPSSGCRPPGAAISVLPRPTKQQQYIQISPPLFSPSSARVKCRTSPRGTCVKLQWSSPCSLAIHSVCLKFTRIFAASTQRQKPAEMASCCYSTCGCCFSPDGG